MQSKKLSVIIAAYNEEPRIGAVLSAVVEHPIVDEVIVVNDGSADKTADIVKQFNATLIDNERNMGKTMSVQRGVKAARNDIVMLLDADLVGLDEDSIIKLASPVLQGEVDWTLSLRKNSFPYMKWVGVDWVSGERVLKKEYLEDPLIWSKPDIGFGLEVLMNKSLLDNSRSFQSIYLPNLKIINKAHKVGIIKGLAGEYKMFSQILKVMPLNEIVKQFSTMTKLNKKYSRQK